MAKNYLDNLVGVFGSPVSENPTSVMFTAAFKKMNLDWKYLTIEVKKESLADAMRGLRAMNMRGINLTIPHKVEVLKYLDQVSPDAKLMGAVNTVRREGEKLIGERGAKTLDGLGMLVYQGAIAFKMWTGLEAPVSVMRKALEEAFR